MAPEFGKKIQHPPLIPEAVLKKHHVHEPFDTRFRAAARLLQAIWREDRDLPVGSYVNEAGKRRKIGSRISDSAGEAGGNFLNADIAYVARREVAYREPGAMMDEERLSTNLLSSMPLVFNLFAPWVGSLEQASCFLREMLPGFSGEATAILFEHSPGRGNPNFTGDYSAFDALVRYVDPSGRRGFVAIEVKYSESMREPIRERTAEEMAHYDALSVRTGLYVDAAASKLRTNPLRQLWREHMLGQSMIDNRLYDEGYLVLVSPELNCQTQQAADLYTSHLNPAADGKVQFVNLTLEDAIETIRLTDPVHADALYRRYCDFWLVDGEMELNAPLFGALRNAKKIEPATPAAPLALPAPQKKRRAARRPKAAAISA